MSRTAALVKALEQLAAGDIDAARYLLPELSRLGWAHHGADGVWRVTPLGCDVIWGCA